MNRAGRMDRLGWIATGPQSRASAVALGAVALAAALAVTGCATTPRSEAVSTTTTTGATGYTPGGVELYVARQTSPAGGCGAGLLPTVEFAPGSADILPGDLPDVDRWAACLQRPELEHTNVVLVGGEKAEGPEGLFYRRSNQVRNALIARGVDARRIIIAPTNASREGGPWASVDGVRLEVTHLAQVRDLAAPDPSVRRAVR